jgi:hypothetical protein
MSLLDLRSGGRRRASALPCRCFRAIRRHLQHPCPTANPSVHSSPIYFTYTSPIPPNGTVLEELSVEEKHIGLAEREILVLGYGYFEF